MSRTSFVPRDGGVRRTFAWVGVVALVFVTSCHRRVQEAVAKRVVSLSPSTTEALAAIGAKDVLVGRSRYCDFPPEVTQLPVVGGYVDPDLEAILTLAPDLVTGARGPGGSSLAEHLARLGIATYFPATESFDDIDTMVRGLGSRTGHVREAGDVVERIDTAEKLISAAVASAPTVRTLLVFGLQPVVAAGPGGFPDELLRRAGGTNVVSAGGAYPTLSIERVLALEPDVVVDAAWGETGNRGGISADSPGWRELRAVKAGRVVTLRDEAVLRPGPRIAEGLRLMAKALHPGVVIPDAARPR